LRVYENKLISRKLVSQSRSNRKIEKIICEEDYGMYYSSNIREVKSGRIRWAGQIARMRVTRNSYKILFRKPKGKRPLVNLDVEERIISK
jgi:hypothetical protein